MDLSRLVLLASLTAALASAPSAMAEGRACEIVTPEDVAGVMGGRPALKPSLLPNGVETCTGKAAGSTVTVRVYMKLADFEAAKEKADAEEEKLQKMGAQIEARRTQGVNCVSIGPGGKANRRPYTTTCTIATKQRAIALEISNPSLSLNVKDVAAIAQQVGSRAWQL